jgi:hypothetical protein
VQSGRVLHLRCSFCRLSRLLTVVFNRLADTAFLQSQIGVDAPEDVKAVSEDKSSSKEEAGVRDSHVGKEDKLPQVGEGLEDDRSSVPAADPEVRQKSENSLAVEELKDSGKEEEQEEMIEVQEDWSVSIVEDLDVLTESWLAGVPAGNAEEHVISREEFLSDDKDDEDTTYVAVMESNDDEKATNAVVVKKDEEEEENANVVFVESKDDEKARNAVVVNKDEEEEKTTDVVLVESKDDEKATGVVVVNKDEEEEKTTDVVIMDGKNRKEHERTTNLIAAESEVSEEKSIEVVQSMSTPAPQVKEENAEEDDYDLVTGEFLSFLRFERGSAAENSESGEDVPDSPRALLLQQFEQEALVEGGLELNFHLPEYAKFRVEGAQEKSNGSRLLPDNQPGPSSVPDNTDNNLGKF